MGFDTNTDLEALAALELELRASRPSRAHEVDGAEMGSRADLEALAALKSELLAAEAEEQISGEAAPAIAEIASAVETSTDLESQLTSVEEPMFAHTAIPA